MCLRGIKNININKQQKMRPSETVKDLEHAPHTILILLFKNEFIFDWYCSLNLDILPTTEHFEEYP